MNSSVATKNVLKLLNQMMKVAERVWNDEYDEEDVVQFGFLLGRGTTDGILTLRHLQEKSLGKKKVVRLQFC